MFLLYQNSLGILIICVLTVILDMAVDLRVPNEGSMHLNP